MQKEDEMVADTRCGPMCSCGASASGERLLGRREFMAYGAAALAAMALAACAPGDLTGTTVPTTILKISDFPALTSVGGVATTSINGVPVAIVREGSTAFSAFSRICPHAGGTLSATGSGFFCPNHGATFDKNGHWIGGQPTSDMTSYSAVYDSTAGTVTVG